MYLDLCVCSEFLEESGSGIGNPVRMWVMGSRGGDPVVPAHSLPGGSVGWSPAVVGDPLLGGS